MQKYVSLLLCLIMFSCGVVDSEGPAAPLQSDLNHSNQNKQAAEIIHKIDFEDGKIPAKVPGFMTDKIKVIGPGESLLDGKALRVNYVPHAKGSAGVDFKFWFPDGLTTNECTLYYDMIFEDGFEFVRGGKLPGLSPKQSTTGGKAVERNKWSIRLMWKELSYNQNSWEQTNGVTLYPYHQDRVQGKAIDVKPTPKDAFIFKANTRYRVSIYVKLNSTKDARDAVVELYINGRKLVESKDLRFWGDYAGLNDRQGNPVTGKDVEVNGIYFSTFHGGNTPTWAPKKTVYAQFDNFIVYEGRYIK